MKARQLIGWIIWTIVVGAVLFLAVREVMSQTLPPLPKRPVLKKKAPAAMTTQGAGALQLITPKAVLPTARKVMLTWNFNPDTNNPSSNIVFVVRRLVWYPDTNSSPSNLLVQMRVVTGTNQFPKASTNWPVISVVTNRSYTQAVDTAARMVMFIVSASNKVTHLESPFATR